MNAAGQTPADADATLTIWLEDGPNIAARAWAARLLAAVAGIPFRVRVARAGAAVDAGPCVYYGRGDVAGAVVIRPSGFLDGDLSRTDGFPKAPAGDLRGMPVLFGEAREEERDGRHVIFADLFAGAFFLASRMEERASGDADEHGRFPATASYLGRNDLLDRALVDEYARFLAEAVRRMHPGLRIRKPWPQGASLAVASTHDIETLLRPRRMAYLAHKEIAAARDLVKGRISRAAVSAGAGLVRGITGENPSWSFARLREAEKPLPGTYYFFGGATSKKDGRYDVGSKEVREVVRALAADGCEVGVHLGYETGSGVSRIEEQKRAVEDALESPVRGTRYHYLRARFPQAWSACRDAGLAYDATLGYPEAAGFRAGTSFPFRPYDFEKGRAMDFHEVPLVAMDGTFMQYQGMTPEETVSHVLRLADTVALTGGVFTLLWHNTMVDPYDKPGPSRAYVEIMETLKAMPAWGTTLSGCVDRWRSYRESLESAGDEV